MTSLKEQEQTYRRQDGTAPEKFRLSGHLLKSAMSPRISKVNCFAAAIVCLFLVVQVRYPPTEGDLLGALQSGAGPCFIDW